MDKKITLTCSKGYTNAKSFFLRSNRKGLNAFTLVELIVVITILAILGTIAFITLQGYSKDARDSVRITDIKSAETGLELFQLDAGKYPEPDNLVSYTGGTSEIKQGILGEGVVRNVKLDKILEDPLTNKNYVYSIFGKGLYYQIAADSEDTETAFIQPTYAAEPVTSIVRGNYKFDPTLPSLILVPSSVTSSGIFDPNVCFVVDGGKNTLNNCVEKKSEMSLKNFDDGLVGYWNFDEIGFVDENNKYGGNNFYKDYSGNNLHAFNSGAIQGVGFVPPTQTGGYIGNGLYFTSGSLILGSDLDSNIENSFTISAISNLYEFKNTYPYIINNRHFTNAYVGCQYNYIIPYVACPGEIEQNLSIDSIGIIVKGYNDYGNLIWTFHDQPFGLRKSNLISNNKFFKIDYTVNNNTVKEFLNGNKIYEYTISGTGFQTSNTGTFIQSAITVGSTLSSNTRYFHGVIDDVKIYNRALSDDEILQQARIAGF